MTGASNTNAAISVSDTRLGMVMVKRSIAAANRTAPGKTVRRATSTMTQTHRFENACPATRQTLRATPQAQVKQRTRRLCSAQKRKEAARTKRAAPGRRPWPPRRRLLVGLGHLGGDLVE